MQKQLSAKQENVPLLVQNFEHFEPMQYILMAVYCLMYFGMVSARIYGERAKEKMRYGCAKGGWIKIDERAI